VCEALSSINLSACAALAPDGKVIEQPRPDNTSAETLLPAIGAVQFARGPSGHSAAGSMIRG
jgi:hypothetical protein